MGCSFGKNRPPANGVIEAYVQMGEVRTRTEELINTTISSVRRKSIKVKGAVIDTRVQTTLRRSFSANKAGREKTHMEAEKIESALKRHSVLCELTENAREEVVRSMQLFTFSASEVVVQEGEPATHFFVVSQGSLQVLAGAKRVNILRTGDSFGEQALLHNTVRSATVRTLDRCALWGVDRQTFQKAFESVNAQRYKENRAFLESVSMLSLLTESQRESLLAVMITHQFPAGMKIVREGEAGDLLFIIKEGSVVCTVKGEEVRRMKAGDYFGEQALLQDSVRTATVIAVDAVRVLSISREQLTQALGNSLQQMIYRNTQCMALDYSAEFSQLAEPQKEALVNVLAVECCEGGDVVIREKAMLRKEAVMVLKGELRYRNGEMVAGRLDIVGGAEMMSESDQVAPQDVIAVGETHLSRFTKETFEGTIGGSVKDLATQNEAFTVLRRVSIFRHFSRERLLKLYSVSLIQALRIVKFPAGAEVFRQDDPGESLFIVKSGQVIVSKDGVMLRAVGRQGFFGERSILLKERRTASVIAETQVECWELRHTDFSEIIDDGIVEILTQRMQLQDDSVTLDQLAVVKELGKGNFGSVFLVVHKEKKVLYALKSVSRRTVRIHGSSRSLQMERELLLQLDHLFIMRLVKTFQDEKRVYFLMEFVHGQDLFDVIRVLGLVKDEHARFYVAALLLILEHLHEANIVYRDLKPENVMIDSSVLSIQGYPKLIDFGTAKKIDGRTFTIVGTPHYMAPEVVLGKGYSQAVDLWSLGIMLFEFVCGTVPFGEDQNDSFLVYEEILKQPLRFATGLPKSSVTRGFLEGLLHKNPSFRLSGGIAKIKKHLWLESFDWVSTIQEKLSLKQLEPPLRPKLRNLQTEVTAALADSQDLREVLDQAEQAALSDSAEDIPEPSGWDKDF